MDRFFILNSLFRILLGIILNYFPKSKDILKKSPLHGVLWRIGDILIISEDGTVIS